MAQLYSLKYNIINPQIHNFLILNETSNFEHRQN